MSTLDNEYFFWFLKVVLRSQIHWGKTKVMMVSRTGDDCKVNVDGQDIAQVEKMKYLGVMLSASGRCDDEIEQRIGAAANVVGAMRKQVLDRRELKKSTKLRVYNAMVLPTLLYGCETWTMQQRHVSSLQALEMRYLRRVQGVTRLNRVRNEDIRRALRQDAVLDVVKAKQIAWREKLEQIDNERLVKRVFEEEAVGRRPRGRPRKRWHENFK